MVFFSESSDFIYSKKQSEVRQMSKGSGFEVVELLGCTEGPHCADQSWSQEEYIKWDRKLTKPSSVVHNMAARDQLPRCAGLWHRL